MKIVLDTNVIIAAFATRGLCAEIFEICLADHEIIVSEHIMLEVERNLIKKLHLPVNAVQDIMGYIRNNSEMVEPGTLEESICKDKEDVKIIGTAVKGNARFIITGDDDLLSLKKYQGVEMFTPREFWDYLKS